MTLCLNSIAKHGKELDLFRRKDPPLLTMEEMEESAASINEIQEKLFEDKVIANVMIPSVPVLKYLQLTALHIFSHSYIFKKLVYF